MIDKTSIWCISKYASPPNYGVGSKLFTVAKRFSDMGCDVLLISSDSNHLSKYPESNQTYNFEKYGNLDHIWIKTMKYDRSASIKRILSWFAFEYRLFRLNKKKLKKPDIIIVSSLSLLTVIYGIYIKKKYGCKLVFEIRDIHPLTLTEELGVSKWNPLVLLLRFIERIGYKKSDLIVGTMPNLKEHVIETIGYEKDVFHSPIGIHSTWSNELEQSDNVDQLFPKTNQFFIGYAGSMGISNAMDNFIEAIERMANIMDVYFVLVGDGDLKASYSKRLSELKNVKMGPKLKQSEIPYFLSKCDLLYLSTHDSKVWKYGQSMNKVIDYMMSGKPVVASYSGYPSMLNEANSGVYVKTKDTDAIIDKFIFFKNMELKERLAYGDRGKAWVKENHSYETITRKYYKKISELI
ncbi:glycosyltransferase family 4 protein [Mobilitalea sibirica]|uniref:Glycosyltransferase family 4 protein n=1 Tax=Mobilitalea sibirica TaxID=1462919 RepID=A0A8J7HAC1_9FIRM|nr:glycosyltransferase family 4 protein [Mobilitalea sibirica]MBH1942046.1 glycosyltransferase family 4 protein [Mobilitalea sibirica]